MKSLLQASNHYLPIGTVLGSYKIASILGQGGFGISYLAFDSQLNRQIVLKEHYPIDLCRRDPNSGEITHLQHVPQANYERSLHAFCQEAHIIASLDYPGVVPVYDIFQALGTAYIVMPYVKGETLDVWITNHADDYEAVTKVFKDLLSTLDYIHSHKVLHRDIKPSNILVKKDMQTVLIDFGAALADVSLRTITVMVSPQFSPPEQYNGRGNIGPWSDIFALGKSFEICLSKHLNKYPPYFKKALKNATSLEVDTRLPNAIACLDLLKSHTNSTKRHFFWTAIVLFFLFTAAGLAYLFSDKTTNIIQQHDIIQTTGTKEDPPEINKKPENLFIKQRSQLDNPHPIPRVPHSLTGYELTLSSDHLLQNFFSPRAGGLYSTGQFLAHYQQLNRWSKGGEKSCLGTISFPNSSIWKKGSEKQGHYAYVKVSDDKALIILESYDELDGPYRFILLHFTTPDSGMAIFTDGEEMMTGNILFMLTPNERIPLLNLPPSNDPLLFPSLKPSYFYTPEAPDDLVGITLKINMSHSEYLTLPQTIPHKQNQTDQAIKSILLQSDVKTNWIRGRYLGDINPILFRNPYVCMINSKSYNYTYEKIKDDKSIITIEQPGTTNQNLYLLLDFTQPMSGTARLYDGNDRLFQNIDFKLFTALDTGSDYGVMPDTYFSKQLKNAE